MGIADWLSWYFTPSTQGFEAIQRKAEESARRRRDAYEDHLKQLEGTTLGDKLNRDPRPKECRFRLQDEGKSYPRSLCEACGRTITTGLGKWCAEVDHAIYPGGMAVDPGDPAGDQHMEWLRKGWSISGEVPAEAGKLVASTMFNGELWLAFEYGLYVVRGGGLHKVTIGNSEA